MAEDESEWWIIRTNCLPDGLRYCMLCNRWADQYHVESEMHDRRAANPERYYDLSEERPQRLPNPDGYDDRRRNSHHISEASYVGTDSDCADDGGHEDDDHEPMSNRQAWRAGSSVEQDDSYNRHLVRQRSQSIR